MLPWLTGQADVRCCVSYPLSFVIKLRLISLLFISLFYDRPRWVNFGPECTVPSLIPTCTGLVLILIAGLLANYDGTQKGSSPHCASPCSSLTFPQILSDGKCHRCIILRLPHLLFVFRTRTSILQHSQIFS